MSWEEIAFYGRKVVSNGFVEGNFGNISKRSGKDLTITKTGTFLDELNENGVVTLPIDECEIADDAAEKTASSELKVHRAVYKKTDVGAIIHVHSPYAVAMSLLETERGEKSIKPIDSEGLLFLKEIPIVSGGIGTPELAENISGALAHARAAIACGHGVFAAGKDLREAYIAAAQTEHAARTAYLCGVARRIF